MKKIFLISIIISIFISLKVKAENQNLINLNEAKKNEILFCLNSLYSAEMAFFEENKSYSDIFEEIGFKEKEICKNINLKLYSPIRDQFIAYAKIENQIWSINEKKQFDNLKTKKKKLKK